MQRCNDCAHVSIHIRSEDRMRRAAFSVFPARAQRFNPHPVRRPDETSLCYSVPSHELRFNPHPVRRPDETIPDSRRRLCRCVSIHIRSEDRMRLRLGIRYQWDIPVSIHIRSEDRMRLERIEGIALGCLVSIHIRSEDRMRPYSDGFVEIRTMFQSTSGPKTG